MNTKQAISHLKRLGWHVSKEGSNYRAHRIGHKRFAPNTRFIEKDYDLYSPRELVRLAKTYSAKNSRQTTIKKAVKSDQKTERRIVRDVISTGDLDKIDELSTEKLGNPWDWD